MLVTTVIIDKAATNAGPVTHIIPTRGGLDVEHTRGAFLESIMKRRSGGIHRSHYEASSSFQQIPLSKFCEATGLCFASQVITESTSEQRYETLRQPNHPYGT
jgi:hypothetical protein